MGDALRLLQKVRTTVDGQEVPIVKKADTGVPAAATVYGT
jgi:hypothetical protein